MVQCYRRWKAFRFRISQSLSSLLSFIWKRSTQLGCSSFSSHSPFEWSLCTFGDFSFIFLPIPRLCCIRTLSLFINKIDILVIALFICPQFLKWRHFIFSPNIFGRCLLLAASIAFFSVTFPHTTFAMIIQWSLRITKVEAVLSNATVCTTIWSFSFPVSMVGAIYILIPAGRSEQEVFAIYIAFVSARVTSAHALSLSFHQ